MADEVEVTKDSIPKRARELMDKGLSALERNNFSYAMDMFALVLEMEPRFLQARKLLRMASVKRFTMSGCGPTTHFMAMATGLPLFVSGLLALKRGKSLKALGIAEKLLRKDPLNLPFVRLLCEAAEDAKMPEAAIHTLVIAREHYPDNVEIINRLGALYTATDQMDEAKKCFERVVELRPQDAIAMKVLKDAMARSTMSKGGWHEVTTEGGTYRNVIKDVKEAEILEQEGKSVRGERSVELLIREAVGKLKNYPENMTERRTLANLYVQVARFDDAARTLEEGRRITGTADPTVDQLLGAIRLKQFDHEIDMRREKGDVSGASAMEIEKRAFVFKDVQSRVERYPNDLPLRYEYGVLLYENGQLNEAIQQFQMAERNPGHRVRSLYYIAMCFKKKRQFDMAREQLEKAASGLVEMDDVKKDIYYELGQVLEGMGDLEQAVNQYYKVIYQVDIGYKDVAAKIECAYKQMKKE